MLDKIASHVKLPKIKLKTLEALKKIAKRFHLYFCSFNLSWL